MAKKKGLWANIHAKRKRGEAPAKKGDKNYPETLDIDEGSMKQARKNVGADKCWDGYKAKGTKKKDGKTVPNCVKERLTFAEFSEICEEYKDLPKRKIGMKAGKKILSAIGHAAKAGEAGEGEIEDQVRTQKANKKGRQAQKMHDTAKKHNPTLSKAKSLKNKLTGMTKNESIQIEDADGNVFAEVVDLIKPEPMTGWRQQVMADIRPENQEYFQEVLDVKKQTWGMS